MLDEASTFARSNTALAQTRRHVPLSLQIELLSTISEAIIRFDILDSSVSVEEKRRVVRRFVFPLRDAFDAQLLPRVAARFADPNSTTEERNSLARANIAYYMVLFGSMPDEVVPFEERVDWLQDKLDQASRLRLVSQYWSEPAT